MENASKALMMAGGILIGIILLTIFVYAFRSGGQFAKTTEDSISDISVAKFNTQFTVYSGRTNITWHELVSLINLVDEINQKSDSTHVKLMIDSNKEYDVSKKSKQMIEELEKQINEKKDVYYKCEDIGYDLETNKVNYIKFTKTTNL